MALLYEFTTASVEESYFAHKANDRNARSLAHVHTHNGLPIEYADAAET